MEILRAKIFNQHNFSEYKELLQEFNLDLDIYYQAEFLLLEAQELNGEFEIFAVTQSEENRVFIYPYIKIGLEGEFSAYFDLVSPYGYAGPFCNDDAFFVRCENEFISYAKSQNIVTEFVRYHFLYNKEMRFSNIIENEINRTLVIIDLDQSWDEIWMKEMSMNNRNYVRKLEKEGYQFEINSSLEMVNEFSDMYYKTMEHAQAQRYFYFKKEYFYKLFDNLHGKVELARVTREGVTYSTIIFFVSGGMVHYYLMGRNLDFPKVPATNLLFTDIVKWSKEKSMKLLNIGGGQTNSPDDSLFKFKRNFSKQTMPFHIGKRIYQKNIYQQLTEKFIAENGSEKYNQVKHILQFYRA